MKIAASLFRATALVFSLAFALLFATGCGGSTNSGSGATGPLSIATTSLPAGTVGVPYSATVKAANGRLPYSFFFTSGTLPHGLDLSNDGILSGTPSVAGTFSLTVTVYDGDAKKASATFSVTIAPASAPPVTITTTSLPAGTVSAPYSASIVAAKGTAPYTFAVTSGTLPAGLTLSTAGVLSGTPTSAATSSFTITVTDAAAQKASATYSLTIATKSVTPVSITTTSLPGGTVSTPYTATIVAENGTAPYTFAVTSGTLPSGLALSGAGVLSGTPATATNSNFTVTVTDAGGGKASATYTVTIAPKTTNTLAITTTSLPSATVNTAYSTTILAANGTAPYTFAITAGNLPAGLSLSTAGVLSGVPSTAATSSFTVGVTDATRAKATATLSLTVAPKTITPVSITTTSLPPGTVKSAYTATILAANGTAPYTFTVTSGTPPAGLSLSSAGVLSGTPTTAAASTFTVTVTDSAGGKATATYTVTIDPVAVPPVTITTSSLPSGTVQTAYAATIAASNGTPPYTFAVTSGNLPAGLSLASSGAITGTPTAAATSTFTVTVTDSTSATATATYTVTIAPQASTPLSVTTSSLPSGTVNATYSSSVAATGGTPPYSFTLASGALPAGLHLASSGAITGTPTTAATSNFTITVADSASHKASVAFSVTISPVNAGQLAVSTTTLPDGTVNKPYTATIASTGGMPSYTYTLNGGALPAGLSLTPAGLIIGTPTAAGTSSFGFNVNDAGTESAYATLSITIAAAPAPLSISSTSLPAGTLTAPYTATISATGGTSPYTFAKTSGTIPTGLVLSPTGVLTGTPTAVETTSFTVTVTDASSNTASKSFSLAVGAASTALTVAPSTLPGAIVSLPYLTNLQASGGKAPYNFTLSNSNLPSGFTLSPAGALTGTATQSGNYTFTATVTDASSKTASATITLPVADAAVSIDTTKPLVTVPETFFGMHTSVYDSSLSDTSALPALLQRTGITTLRYPGGSYADRYHWAQYSLTPLYAGPTPACYIQNGPTFEGTLAYGADFGSFVRTLQATGTQALITVNYGTSVADSNASITYGDSGEQNHCSEPNTAGQPQEAAAWVAYANGDPSSAQVIGVDAVGFDWKTVGFWASLRGAQPIQNDDGYNFLRLGLSAPIGIKYWEIGNEMYYNGWSGNRNFEADLHAPYNYPNGYFGGDFDSRDENPALSPTAYGNNSIAFIKAMKAVDPSILIGIGFASPGATDPIPLNWNPDLAQAACTAGMFDLAIIHYYPGTYLNVQPSELLSLPQSDLPRQIAGIQADLAQYCPANSSKIQFFLSETSPNGSLGGNFPTPVLGLFAIDDYLTALQQGVQNIDWLELHNGTYLDGGENPNPVYYGLELAHQLAGIGDSLVQATSTSGTIVSWATLKTNGQKAVLLINADGSNSQTVQLDVAGATLGATASQYTFGISTSQNGPDLPSTTFPIPGNAFTVTVPPYTALELIIP